MKDLNLDLLDNGFDFAKSGISNVIKHHDGNSVKYAILHLASGIELIFKYRLMQGHWSFIFENIDNATPDALDKGDFQSVNFNTAISRLEKLCSVEFSDKDKLTLNNFKKLRNKIEHFQINEKKEHLIGITSQTLSVLVDFVIKELDLDDPFIQEHLNSLQDIASKFDIYIKKKHKQFLSKYNVTDEELEYCPNCSNRSFLLTDEFKCGVCNYSDTPEEVATLYAQNIMSASAYIAHTKGGDFPVTECLECGTDAMVLQDEYFFCFNCHFTGAMDALSECSSCGDNYLNENNEMGICENCIAAMISKD